MATATGAIPPTNDQLAAAAEKLGIPLLNATNHVNGRSGISASNDVIKNAEIQVSTHTSIQADIQTSIQDVEQNNKKTGFAASIQEPDLAVALTPYGLTPGDVVPLGIKFITAAATQLKFSVPLPAILIPYCDIELKPSVDQRNGLPYERARLWGYTGKGKYRAPFGAQLHAYLTPWQTLNWPKVASSADMDLFLTEGEFKAIRANLVADWPHTIGLTGVDCLYSGSTSSFAQELNAFAWRGRSVFIVFDAPMHDKLRASITRCATALIQRGAKVSVLIIDETPTYQALGDSKQKMGLDDYLNAGGTLDELLATVKQYDGDDETNNPLLLNLAILLGESKPLFVETTGPWCGIFRDKAGIMTTLATKTTVVLEKNKPVYRPAFPVWLASKNRQEIGVVTVRPDLPPLAVTPNGDWNAWRGFATMPRRNRSLARKFFRLVRLFFSDPVPGRPDLRALSKDGRIHRNEFIRQIAHLFQFPNERRTSSFNFVGSEGVGKSLLLEIVAKIIGLQNGGAILDADAIESDWSDWGDGCIFAVINEPANKSTKVAKWLKNLRTADTIRVNKKYGACYSIENHLTIGMTSNAYFTTAISAEARRDWVWRPQWEKETMYRGRMWRDYCAEVGALIDSPQDDMRAAILWELLYHVNLTEYDPRRDAGGSLYKQIAAEASLGDIDGEKDSAVQYVINLVAEQELVIFTSDSWESLKQELSIDKLSLQSFRAELRGAASQRGLVYESHSVKLAVVPGGKQVNVWYVAKQDISYYDVEKRRSSILGLNARF